MKKVDYLAKFILMSIFCSSLLMICCTSDDKIENKNTAPILSDQVIAVSEDIDDIVSILTLSATDTEGAALTYTITQNSNDLFEISDTGIITLKAGKTLDFETNISHILTIQVSDGELNTLATVTINVTDVADSVSATASNIFSGSPRRGSEYNFSDSSIPVQIEVENYNENYSYELKLTGTYFKKEYIVSLSKQAVSVVIGEKESKDIRLAKAVPVKDNVSAPTASVKTRLVANVKELQMEADAYTAVLVEKESNTELVLVGVDENTAYTILDLDSPHFLSTTQIEDIDWQILSTLNLSQTKFRVRPANTGYINGVGVQLVIYDIDLNKLGTVGASGSNGQTGRGTYSYRFNSSSVNSVIPSNGEYLFRLEETEDTNDLPDKIYKKGIFQKIQVNKAGGLIAI